MVTFLAVILDQLLRRVRKELNTKDSPPHLFSRISELVIQTAQVAHLYASPNSCAKADGERLVGLQ